MQGMPGFLDTIFARSNYFQPLYNKILNYTASTSLDLADKIDSLKNLENHLPPFGNAADSMIAYIGLAVAKYSAYLWAPESEDGLEYGQYMGDDLVNTRLTIRQPCWVGILKKDMEGAWKGAIVRGAAGGWLCPEYVGVAAGVAGGWDSFQEARTKNWCR
ncbi:MAG: hypothetical protein WAR77_08120, partial [Saprospiraceae bacterium]